MDNLLIEMENPGAKWRAKPFWALNDELETGEIRNQIKKFKEMGFGGYFMHSRVGLKTPFLGEEWFEMIAAGIDEGKRTGLETWLYDEDRWPSGIAGGYVTMDHRNRVKRLHCLRTKGDCVPVGALAVFKAQLRNNRLISYEKADPASLFHSEDILAFCVRTGYPNDANIGFYNGTTYIDTLNKQTVAKFIDLAYKPYLRFKDEFGTGVKGMFTDEPNRSVFLGTPHDNEWEREGSQYQIPWTPSFPTEFRDRKGYDILECLPEIFFNVDGTDRSKVRYDVSDVIAQLFTEAFITQVSAWCAENGIALTGHYLGEDDLFMLNWGGGVVDRFYEPMEIPGVDLINEREEYMAPKQVQSAARQFGKKWTMCEMYASSGWGYSFQQYKSYGEWNAVFGINLRCPHLSLYSIAGQRKRDCPPNISFQQAWYKDYKVVEDHFARLGVAVSEGDPMCSLLVIHPFDATAGILLPGWASKRPGPGYDEPFWRYETEFKKFTRSLMGLQIDFDTSEEAMIEKHGRVEIVQGRALLAIGKMKYTCVAAPPLVSLRGSVAALLADFAAQGGSVVFVGEAALIIDFEDDARFAGFPVVKNETNAVRAEFAGYGTVSVSGATAFDVLAMHRRGEGRDTALLVNTRLDAVFDGMVRIRSSGQVQLYETLTCERFILPAKQDGEWLEFPLEMPRGGSALLFIVKEREILPVLGHGSYTELPCPGPYDVELDSPNVLLFNRPCYRIESGKQGTAHILEVDKSARDHMGFERRSNSMYQPWFRKTFFGLENRFCQIELVYSFKIEHLPEDGLLLCLEQPQRHELSINGAPLEQTDCGFFADKCIRKLKLDSKMLKPGVNTITSICRFDEETDLEAMYLLGDFGVRLDGVTATLTKPVKRLGLGDISTQGLPFYAGGIKYRIRAPKINGAAKVRADGFRGIALRLHEPGRKPRLIPFEPYEAEMSSSDFSIELICSMGNAFDGMRADGELEVQGLINCPLYMVIR